MISFICASVNPQAAERLRENIATTIGCEFEFTAYDNRDGKMGICAVYNHCAEQSTGDVLVFLHEDVQFDSQNWGKELERKLSEEDCGVIGFAGYPYKTRVLTPWHSFDLQSMRVHYIQHVQRHGNNVLLKREKNPDNVDFTPVITLDGLCLAVRRDVWAQVRFDENMLKKFHGYDIDFTIAVHVAGYKNYVCNTIWIEHFSIGNYSISWLDDIKALHTKWQNALPLSATENTTTKKWAKRERLAQYGFLKFLIRKRIDGLNLAPMIRDFIDANPCYIKAWTLPLRLLKSRLS